MANAIENPFSKIIITWSKAVEKVVGVGNYGISQSATPANEKPKYARIFMIGNPTGSSSLSGDECSTIPSIQVDSFAKGKKALSDVYKIDDVSHKAMVSMGFRRIYGPEVIENVDSTIKRAVSRYKRVYTGQLLGEK